MHIKPLEGVVVLDLTRLLPGPYCTLMLADLGADVLKIEEPKTGDYLRWWPPFWPHGETPQSAAFGALNRNKRSIVLNLKSADGVAVLEKLCAKADVLVEGFRPGVMDSLGLGYKRLESINPRLIVCSISGYGHTGPMRERAGHDLNYVARSGLLIHNAISGEMPHPLSVQLADLAGGALYPATAILEALYAREKSGHGTHIDAAMSDACVALMPFFVADSTTTGRELEPGRELLTGGVPAYAVYPTSDAKYLAVAGLEPKFWQAMCAALNRNDFAASGLLTGADGRRVWRELAAIFCTQTQAYWVGFFAEVDCCVEPLLTVAEALDDSHHRARGLFMQVPQAGVEMTQIRTPIFMSRYDGPAARPAPALGQDTEDVLRELKVR